MRHFLFVLLGTAALLSAQEYRGTFSGSVTDAQGSAILAKVKIVVTRDADEHEGDGGI